MNPSILMPIMIFMTKFYHSPLNNRRSDSVYYFIKTHSLALIAGIILFAASCEEDDFVNIVSTDTVTVRSLTVYSDSVQAGNTATSYLGELDDPYFGKTTAEFVTQIRLGSTWTEDYFYVDSVKLYLKILTVEGTPALGNVLTLSEIDEKIYTDSLYYSSRPVPLTGFSVTDINLPLLKADTINDIILDIPPALGTYILTDKSMLNYNTPGPNFTDYFKGLYFQLSCPGEPVLLSLSLDPPSTYSSYSNYFIFHGHDEVGDPKTFYFILDAVNRNACYNLYSHESKTKIPHVNEEYYDTLSYLQNMNGVYTKLLLPGLEGIKNDPAMDNVAINKARLKLPVKFDNDIYTKETIPSQIYARYLTRSGVKYLLPDFLNVSSSFYDGTPDTSVTNYILNIATFVQGYLEDTDNELLPEIEIFLTPLSTSNLIIKANNNPTPIKFELTYTKF
jgi:hypothetical protein